MNKRHRASLPHPAALNLSPVTAKASLQILGRNMAGNEQPIAVALDNATVAFRVAGDRVYTAVEQASLSVAHGEFVAIVGPTGCGKSTLLNVAAGLLKPAAGSVKIFDEPFGPLDAQTRQIMGNLLLELWNADRKAVLFVTHDLEEAIALADRVVIMSAGPSARIIGDWRVPLARPRDIFEVRLQKEFHSLHHEIWSVLKAEVLKGYAQSGGG